MIGVMREPMKIFYWQRYIYWYSYGEVGKESAWNSGDGGPIPWSGRSPGEGNGDPLQ